MATIEVDDVSKRFRLLTERPPSLKHKLLSFNRARPREHWALRNVSFSVDEGSMFALVGHNGSGKSTLLRCIANIYKPTSGEIRTQGRISALLELGAGFHPDLTGRENVYLNASLMGLGSKEIDKVFDSIVDFSGIEAFIDSPVKHYSSGMYVRLGFAVAVHVDPSILIIDEVIAVGDEEFQRRCMDHLYSLRKQGVTIVVVTHSTGLVRTMCDRAIWLDHGVPQMEGTAVEVANAYLESVNRSEEEARQDDAEEAEDGEETARPGYYPPREEIACTGVEFYDAQGERVSMAFTGEPLKVQIDYDARKPLVRPRILWSILHESGVHIGGDRYRWPEGTADPLSGPGWVAVSFDRFPLMPGNYDISVVINDEHGQHTFQALDRQFHLTVRPGRDTEPVGFVELGGTWSGSAALARSGFGA